jgi:hypothetical protein
MKDDQSSGLFIWKGILLMEQYRGNFCLIFAGAFSYFNIFIKNKSILLRGMNGYPFLTLLYILLSFTYELLLLGIFLISQHTAGLCALTFHNSKQTRLHASLAEARQMTIYFQVHSDSLPYKIATSKSRGAR